MTGEGKPLHESGLSVETLDRHRALTSLMEELEAIDWYAQRIEAAHDEELKRILQHNRDEEVEHAAMVLEWLRRRDPVLDRELRDKLFKEGPIAHEEEDGDDGGSPDLGIGSLKEGTT
jgi:ferritin-like protein